jgi:hypothetical protein
MSESLDQSQLTARLEQTQPLRELAHSWYALSVACRRIGAMMERAAKEILYAPSNNSGQPSTSEVNDDE